MKKTFLALLLTGIIIFSLTGCILKGEEKVATEEKTTTETTATETATEEVVTPTPGEIPFDYPTVPTTAKKDEYVLVPSADTLAAAVKDGGENSSFIFYSATMVEPGEVESVVKDFMGEYTMPNSLIVPVPSGESVETGDVVLTWWQSGSGLIKGIVEQGGTAPTVRYLDTFLTESEVLTTDSFHKLSETLEPGISVAVNEGGEYSHAVVINVAGDKVLVMGWAGMMEVVKKSDVKIIPPTIEVAVGDVIMAPVIGTYQEVTVTAVDAGIGQVTASYEWAGEQSEDIFVMNEITKAL